MRFRVLGFYISSHMMRRATMRDCDYSITNDRVDRMFVLGFSSLFHVVVHSTATCYGKTVLGTVTVTEK
jgi:hypothetical protein